MEKKTDYQLTEWLSNLERESWQMELLISAIAIFLLFNGREAVQDLLVYMANNPVSDLFIMQFILSAIQLLDFSMLFLSIGLTAHLALRGLWIGAIGLQSVSPEINYKRLRFSPLFTDKLSEKYKTIQDFIVNLDKWCSLIFSICFLTIFAFLSFYIFLAIGGLVAYPTINLIPDGSFLSYLLNFIYIIYLIGGLFYAFDFLSLGLLKKVKFLSRIYYPIYRFYGFITFAHLYRGLYYTIASNVNRWVWGITFFLLFFLTQVNTNIAYENNVYFLFDKQSNSLHYNYYEDEQKEGEWIDKVSISSSITNSNFLPLFIRYWAIDDQLIAQLCEDTLSFNKHLAIGSQQQKESDMEPFIDKTLTKVYSEEAIKESLFCLTNIYQIYLNEKLVEQPEYFYYEHPNQGEKGIKTYLDIENLPKGKNSLKIIKKDYHLKLSALIGRHDSIVEKTYATIHFWKE